MPQRPRIHIDGVPLHIVQRGHNRGACFFDDQDRHTYLRWLSETLQREHCQLHAYVLMTNHVHLLLTPEHATAVPRLIISVGRRYVQYIHHTYGRTDTLWDSRYKSSLVQAETYLFLCQRYIELNPVREGVSLPRDRFWDIRVPKIDSPTRQPLDRGRPASAAAPDFLVGKPGPTAPANGSTACRMRLHTACGSFGTSGPFAPYGRTPAPTPSADYPPRASHFPGGQRGYGFQSRRISLVELSFQCFGPSECDPLTSPRLPRPIPGRHRPVPPLSRPLPHRLG
jgi:REP element-mobilizing transposase RayT